MANKQLPHFTFIPNKTLSGEWSSYDIQFNSQREYEKYFGIKWNDPIINRIIRKLCEIGRRIWQMH